MLLCQITFPQKMPTNDPDLAIGIPPDVRRPQAPIILTGGIAGKCLGRTAGIKGMNIVDLDSMTLLDDETREAATMARDAYHLGWRRREGRSGDMLCAKAKSNSFLQTTAFFRIDTGPIPPKLRDAILGLHRDDALRRAYVRRWWTETGAASR